MEKKKLIGKTFVGTVLLAVLIAATAVNASYTGPSWRGGSNTTFEQWSFGDSNTAPLPDAGMHNPYGTPQTWINSSAVWNSFVDTHSGAWTLGTGEIDINIPNNPAAQTQKDMWVELIWKGVNLTFRPEQPLLGVYPAGGYTQLNTAREDTPLGDGWTSTVFKIGIWPNPTSEWIVINGDIYVDQLVVDTRCVPEPATLALISTGAFMAIRRKKSV